MLFYLVLLLLIPTSLAQCKCENCDCNRSPCPAKVHTFTYISHHCGFCRPWIFGQSINTPLGVHFKVFTVNEENLQLFIQGKSFTYYPSYSVIYEVLCFSAGPTKWLDADKIYIIFQDTDWVWDLKLIYRTNMTYNQPTGPYEVAETKLIEFEAPVKE